jgi:hypothetical protein
MRDMAGSATAPAAKWRNCRRGSFISPSAAPSFDHLVGAAEQRRWHVQAERLGGLEVQKQFRFTSPRDGRVPNAL